ncbi:MAG: ABC transporter permease subunit [Clostridia bacterium]|nr:ABC transporter permease subunit [Clostridia bacterium]
MKSVLTIIKKEFSRFFKDKRMIATIFLPGILIFALYSIIGSFTDDLGKVDVSYKPTAVVINMPEDTPEKLASYLAYANIKDFDEEQAKSKVEDGDLDFLLIFPKDFSFNSSATAENLPNIQVYYNSSSDNSYASFSLVCALLQDAQKTSFTINKSIETLYDLASESDVMVQVLSMLVPMLMFALLASACVSIAPESIAGEKERGTMATLLITPIKRWQLALGKIISLACFSMLSGISSFIGVILSLPKMIGGMGLNASSVPYGFGDYVGIFFIIISVTLVIVSAFAAISTLSKNVKEAGAMIAPLMIVIILLGMVSMFVSNISAGLCAIPLLGSGLALTGIMSLTASPLGIALSVISNLIVTAALVVLLGFMFRSEKIMFKK